MSDAFPTSGYAWLMTATVDCTPVATTVVRITSHTAPITWNSKTYEPYPFTVGTLTIDAQGRRDTIDITLDNRSLEAGRWVASANGFREMPVELDVVQVDLLGASLLSVRGVIYEPVVTEEAVVLPIRQSKAAQRTWPWMRFVPGCHAIYKDPTTCGYDGPLTSCAQTLSDCIKHGEDEFANRRAVLHPRRFHGFPGIPRESRR